jgi:hypothetical protein
VAGDDLVVADAGAPKGLLLDGVARGRSALVVS